MKTQNQYKVKFLQKKILWLSFNEVLHQMKQHLNSSIHAVVSEWPSLQNRRRQLITWLVYLLQTE